MGHDAHPTDYPDGSGYLIHRALARAGVGTDPALEELRLAYGRGNFLKKSSRLVVVAYNVTSIIGTCAERVENSQTLLRLSHT